MITVHHLNNSRSQRVLWLLEELGLPYEKVKLDLPAGDQRKTEYLTLNPNGKVPLLVDDGTHSEIARIQIKRPGFGRLAQAQRGFNPIARQEPTTFW